MGVFLQNFNNIIRRMPVTVVVQQMENILSMVNRNFRTWFNIYWTWENCIITERYMWDEMTKSGDYSIT
jgi:hypothetical protein